MKINIYDLDDGIHEFEYVLNRDEIKLPHDAEFPNPVYLHIYLDKIDTFFRIKIRLNTEAEYVCDRCLEPFRTFFEESSEHLYQLGHSDLDYDEEIEVLPENSREIDLSNPIFEQILLNRPIKILCKEDCKGLCAECGANLNEESCSCSTNKIDPRFESLKRLLK